MEGKTVQVDGARPFSVQPAPHKTPFGSIVAGGHAFTAEDRARARAARAAKVAAGAHLRRDFLDAAEWDRLAQERGIRLPAWYYPMTPGSMRRWLQRLGLNIGHFQAWCGFRTLGQYIDAAPDWPLRSFVGLMLETL